MKNSIKFLISNYISFRIVLPFLIFSTLIICLFVGGSYSDSLPLDHWLQDVIPYAIFLTPLFIALIVFIGLFLNSKKEGVLEVKEKVMVKNKTMFKDVILPAIVAVPGLFGVSLIFNIFAAVDPSTPRDSLIFNEKYGISAPSLPGIIVCIVLLVYAYRSYKIIKK